MENVIEMILVGNNKFSSKDKTTNYFVIQALYNEADVSKQTNKATLINIFVTEELYNSLAGADIGTALKVQVIPNLSTGKVFYKIVD